MSKIGKQPIKIPEGVTVELRDGDVVVKNSKVESVIPMLSGVSAAIKDGEIAFSIARDSKQTRSNWGTIRSLTNNVIGGLTKGYEKTLILEGVGYRITKEGNDLSLNLGFSHPVKYPAPQGITFEVEKNTILKIKGFDKQVVGQTAAEVRALKKPEPYKGKGFHYSDEVVKRKAGKKAATTTGGGA